MMRKKWRALLCICLILAMASTGCKKRSSDIEDPGILQDSKDDLDGEGAGQEEIDSSGNNPAVRQLSLNEQWKEKKLESGYKTYTPPAYQANMKPYTIAEDLSNIENINQFQGFTAEQVKNLVENGFLVLKGSSTRMHYIYDTNEYQGIPNFITTDSMLHTYHQFYDLSLIAVETGSLYPELDTLTKTMLEQSIRLYYGLEDEELLEIQEKNIVYFLISRMLFKDSMEVQTDISNELTLQKEWLEIAEQEFELIQQAEGYVKSPYLDSDFDYSQFTIRGHYTKSESLGKYFKTVMWFGTAPTPLIYEDTMDDKGVFQALLMAYTAFLDQEGSCAADAWMKIYEPTAQYVGVSDDINVFLMNTLRQEVYGEDEDPNIFNDPVYYDKLKKAVQQLPEPQISPEILEKQVVKGKQFRFMGQRYILDSDIMQALMKPILRPVPTALDVMGVLGSNTAEQLLFNEYKPQEAWPEYTQKYEEQKNKAAAYGTEEWGRNLYNGWIWTLQESLKEYGKNSGMPYFMNNQAWNYKTLNTALGSYTELKHDTVLYGKQSVAEMGGPTTYAKYHYVEPNVELYSKLLYLTENSIDTLERFGMMNDNLKVGTDYYKELLELLIECSIKELNNELLTEEQYNRLLWYGGLTEYMHSLFYGGIPGDESVQQDVVDLLVTDVATIESSYLSLATGFFDQIYVVIPVGEQLYLSRGAVYSHYEFLSGVRLTDEEWRELQGMHIIHDEYGDYIQYGEVSKQLPEQPEWVKRFKWDRNEVEITPLEVIWENESR